MPVTSACPDSAQLYRLASGQLPPAEEEAVLAHLEGCTSCAQQVQSVPVQDALVGLMRQAKGTVDGPDQDAVVRLVERIRRLGPASTAGGQAPTLPPHDLPAEPIVFSCPGCGKPLQVKGELAGKQVRCPQCRQVIPVPASAVPAPRAPSAALEETGAACPEDRTEAMAGGGEKDLVSFLAPPQGPGELGRLGTYRVLQVLGAGGMGVVFRAEDVQLQRPVALKTLLPSLAASAPARQRFLREAKAAAALKHDHVVSIYQVGEDRGVPYLAMEFLEGESLEQRLAREGKLPLAEVLRIGREVTLGLEAAHRRGLIHRDIKPGNIWLEAPKGRVKLLDFGVARLTGDDMHLTRTGTLVGTPAYMAPEQARGEAVDARCDLFSLGVVLYRMATGRLPFAGTDTMSVLIALAIDTPTPACRVDAEVPAGLSELIDGLLAKNPQERRASAGEVAAALEALQSSLAPSPAPAPPLTPTASPRRRRGLLMAAAAGLLLLVGGGILLPQIIVRITDSSGKTHTFTAQKVEILPGPDKNDKDTGGTGDKKSSATATERQVAEWVLSVGGKVVAQAPGYEGKGWITAARDLPKGDFHVHLVSLDNLRDRITDADLKRLKALPKLSRLELHLAIGITDAGLAHLESLSDLTGLDLSDTQVSDAGMAHLNKHIAHLNLTGTRVTDAGLKHLRPLPLAWLFLSGPHITDAGLKHLRNFEGRALLLNGCPVTDAGLEQLVRLRNAHSLEVTDSRVSARGVARLKKVYPGLNVGWSERNRTAATAVLTIGGSVSVRVKGQEDKVVKSAGDLPDEYFQITRVNLTGVNKPLGEVLEMLTRLTDPVFDHFEGLDASETALADNDLIAIQRCPMLTDLVLSRTKVTDAGLARLKGMPKLRRLVLDGTDLRGSELDRLKDLPALTELRLGCPILQDHFLGHFEELPHLKRLSLAGSGVTDEGLKHLRGLSELEVLDLTRTAVTADGAAGLQKALAKCRVLSGTDTKSGRE